MKTRYRIIYPDARPAEERETFDYEHPMRIRHFETLLRPILDGDYERVRVFWPWGDEKPKYRDMFVDEDGIAKGKPVNPLATQIYHYNVIVHDPDGLGSPRQIAEASKIHGVAVLFEKPVWV